MIDPSLLVATVQAACGGIIIYGIFSQYTFLSTLTTAHLNVVADFSVDDHSVLSS